MNLRNCRTLNCPSNSSPPVLLVRDGSESRSVTRYPFMHHRHHRTKCKACFSHDSGHSRLLCRMAATSVQGLEPEAVRQCLPSVLSLSPSPTSNQQGRLLAAHMRFSLSTTAHATAPPTLHSSSAHSIPRAMSVSSSLKRTLAKAAPFGTACSMLSADGSSWSTQAAREQV